MFAILTIEIAATDPGRRQAIARRIFDVLQTRHDQNVFGQTYFVSIRDLDDYVDLARQVRTIADDFITELYYVIFYPFPNVLPAFNIPHQGTTSPHALLSPKADAGPAVGPRGVKASRGRKRASRSKPPQ